MFRLCFVIIVAGVLGHGYAAEIHTFKKVQLSDQFWGEGANFGDFNKDGKMDIVSGPYWYAGPDFKERREYYPATTTFTLKGKDGQPDKVIPGFEGGLGVNNAYSDNFFAFTYDFNKDGWMDIMIYGFPGLDASWYENPKGKEGHWKRHIVYKNVDNESPGFADIDGDKKPDIVCNSGGYFGYVTADWSDPTKEWTFHPISPKGNWQRFTHGLGFGDVNGDKKIDILEKDGWWEQPATLKGNSKWSFHPFKFSDKGGSQMFAYDFNGDGLNDVLTSLEAHGYGVAWCEQLKGNGEIKFKKHLIVNKTPADNKYGVVFSQPHAVDLIDMDGDGLKDVVTGKRFWAHGPAGDVDSGAPSVLYWFKLTRPAKGEADFVPHLIDNDSGIGTQVIAGNIQNKKYPDVVVGNKKGTFVFLHQTKKVSKEEWNAAQPKPVTSK